MRIMTYGIGETASTFYLILCQSCRVIGNAPYVRLYDLIRSSNGIEEKKVIQPLVFYHSSDFELIITCTHLYNLYFMNCILRSVSFMFAQSTKATC